MSTAPCLGAIIAGGASSRMGSVKAETELGGRTLGLRALDTLRSLTDEVVQIGGAPIRGAGIKVLPDGRAGIGPAAGIETALQSTDRPVVALAVDLPLISPGVLQACLAEVQAGAPACAPRDERRWHPLCGAYGQSALPALIAQLDGGDPSLQRLLAGLEAAALLGVDRDELRNVNTPEDLDAIRPRFA